MPRSLSGRCHTTSSLETFLLTSAPWGSCIANASSLPLKRSLETSASETSRHLLTANKTPLPCHGGERWIRGRDCRSLKSPADKKKKCGCPDSWHGKLGYPPDGQATPILVATVTRSTPPPSAPDQISLPRQASQSNTSSCYSPVGDTAAAKERSEVQGEAISRWTRETRKVCLCSPCNDCCCFYLTQFTEAFLLLAEVFRSWKQNIWEKKTKGKISE